MKKLVALASGRGSNFQALVEGIQKGTLPGARMEGLLCDQPNAGALEIAKQHGVPIYPVPPDLKRAELGSRLQAILASLNPDYVLLAGFMRILPAELIRAWPQRIVNIHPSLLPSFPGLHPQRQALEGGVRYSGCTVHLVNEAVDDGPILGQAVVEIADGDTEESLGAKILREEHRLYVETVRRLCNQGFSLKGRRVHWGAE